MICNRKKIINLPQILIPIKFQAEKKITFDGTILLSTKFPNVARNVRSKCLTAYVWAAFLISTIKLNFRSIEALIDIQLTF